MLLLRLLLFVYKHLRICLYMYSGVTVSIVLSYLEPHSPLLPMLMILLLLFTQSTEGEASSGQTDS